MNWFNVLKNAGLAQRQRQGFRLDDKDEDYVLEDEDDCFQKLYEYLASVFPNKKMEDGREGLTRFYEGTSETSNRAFLFSTFYLNHFRHVKNKIDLVDADEEYCQVLNHCKSIDFDELISNFKRKGYNGQFWQERTKEIGPNVFLRYEVGPVLDINRKVPPIGPRKLRVGYHLKDGWRQTPLLRFHFHFNSEDLE